MKRKLKKSYRLGVSASLITGIILGLLMFMIGLTLKDHIVPLANFSILSIFFFNQLAGIMQSLIIGIIFIALLNVLPSDNIFTKFVVLNIILTIIFLPFSAIFSTLPIIYLIIDLILSIIIFPIIFTISYITIAKNFSGITRVSKTGFVFTVLGLIIFIFGTSMAITLNDMINLENPAQMKNINRVSNNQEIFMQSNSKPINIDESQLEKEIFNRVNQERTKLGKPQLIWDARLHSIAKDYSKHLSQTKTFSHISDYGETLNQRFKNSGLYYIVGAENLFMVPKKFPDIGQTTVDKWLDSPGHRSMIVDKDDFFSHAAVGVFCDEEYCYATMDFAAFEIKGTYNLEEYEYIYFSLNDESLGLADKQYPVKIDISSDNPVDIYIFEDMDHFSDFEYEDIEPIYKKFDTRQLSLNRQPNQNSYLFIMNTGEIDANIEYSLAYN